MKKLTLIFGIFLIAVGVAVAQDDDAASGVVTVNQVINPHSTNATDYVSDMAHVFSPAQEIMANDICGVADKGGDLEILVVTVPSIGDADPFQFSLDLYERIGIGRKDRGMLIFVAVNDHKWEIRTGYGAEGRFTDAICSDIGRNYMVPKFKEEKYAEGIIDALVYINRIATSDDAYNEMMAEREQAAQLAAMQEERDSKDGLWIVIAIWVIVFTIRFFINRSFDKASQVEKPADPMAIQAKYSILAEYEDCIEIQEEKSKGIEFWDKQKFTRTLTYYVGPAIATGVIVELTTFDTFFTMIFVCNTWVALSYVLSRVNFAKKHTCSDYDKKRVYDEGLFKNRYTLAACAIAPWVTIPALLLAIPARNKYRNAAPPCPKCGGNMTECTSEEDMVRVLDEKHITERRITSRSFKLYKCENGHNIIDVKDIGTKYSICSHCGARACIKTKSNVVQSATFSTTGLRENYYTCEHCHDTWMDTEVIPVIEISDDDNDSSSSSYGGSSGGSYGGGHSGGGGAGGSW